VIQAKKGSKENGKVREVLAWEISIFIGRRSGTRSSES